MNIPASIFKAYDIRGIIDQQLTPELVEKIGQAIGSESIAKGERHIVVARDGRLSGPAFVSALKAGIKKSGAHVIDIGMVPTPILYYATWTKNATTGIMITGSHNPPEYNGFKIIVAGNTLSGDRIQDLKHRITNNDFLEGAGSSSQISITDDYLNEITSKIKLKKKIKLVIDCGNGVAGICASQLYRQMGCDVIELFCTVDGNFPNHHPDPSNPKNLEDIIKCVLDNNADVGFAFDGDGDRLGLIDNKGNIIWADRQMMLYSADILSRNPQAKIVFDVKCTNLLAKEITKNNGIPIMSRTGHSFIKAKIKEEQALLGGEMSGHIFFKERWYGFDDALYTGARLLEILSNKNKTCFEIFDALPNQLNTPEIQIHFDNEGEQFKAVETLKKSVNFPNANLIFIDGIRVEFEDSWGLVRASNTTPCLVLRFEATTQDALDKIVEGFKIWFLENNLKWI
jgi:phosphomannomutase/phosphoglucomutase